jgi:choline dehydrogenase
MHSSSLSTGESTPGSQVPDNAERGSDADWKTWIQSSFESVSHPIGTAAMMQRSLGGLSKTHNHYEKKFISFL